MSGLGTEFKVGLFTLIGLVATAVTIFFVSPELFDREERTRYYTSLKDASGILENTHVKTNGVTIGRVAAVRLDDVGTRVELEVLSSVRIPEGSKIAIRTVGFLGDKFIDLVRPEGGGPALPEGGLIPPAGDTTELAEVMRMVGSVATDLKKVTENLAKVLGDRQGEEKLTAIVDNIEKVTAHANAILADNRNDMREMIENFREVSHSLRLMASGENRARVDTILAKFDDSMSQVRGASENIRLISERIEKGQGTIGRLVNDDKTLTELEGAVKEVRQALAPVSKLQVAVDAHSELRRDMGSQTFFNIRLLTRPDAYYVAGFTDRSERTVDTSTRTIDGDTADGTTRVEERIRDQRALRINLQIAKRWGPLGARFGLFETTGGVAGDLYLWRDRVKLTLEAYEFAKKNDELRRIAHLKAYASVLFFDHLVAMAGVDDPTRRNPETGAREEELNTFFGAGLSFNDQDLKAFFGLASAAIR